MSSRVESVTIEGGTNEKLKMAAFAVTINRDSLSRECPQSVMLAIESLILYLNSLIYASLQRAILKDEETMDKLHFNIQESLNDLKEFQKHLFDMDKKYND